MRWVVKQSTEGLHHDRHPLRPRLPPRRLPRWLAIPLPLLHGLALSRQGARASRRPLCERNSLLPNRLHPHKSRITLEQIGGAIHPRHPPEEKQGRGASSGRSSHFYYRKQQAASPTAGRGGTMKQRKKMKAHTSKWYASYNNGAKRRLAIPPIIKQGRRW